MTKRTVPAVSNRRTLKLLTLSSPTSHDSPCLVIPCNRPSGVVVMLRDQLMQAKGQFDAILRTDLQALNRRLQEQNAAQIIMQ